MKSKITLFCFIFGLLAFNELSSQSGELTIVDYETIAEGTDSPIENLHIVCFNKYFNKDYLSFDFRKKYNLNEKTLYKKKILIEIFRTDEKNTGLDKIDLVSIRENDKNLIIEYNLVNANKENDDKQQSPFLVVQVGKSKKQIKFIANGIELGKKAKDIYVD